MTRAPLAYVVVALLAELSMPRAEGNEKQPQKGQIHFAFQKQINAKQIKLNTGVVSKGILYSFQDLTGVEGSGIALTAVDLQRTAKQLEVWVFGKAADKDFPGVLRVAPPHVSSTILFHVPFKGSNAPLPDLYVQKDSWSIEALEKARLEKERRQKGGVAFITTKQAGGQRKGSYRKDPVPAVFALFFRSGETNPTFYYEPYTLPNGDSAYFILGEHSFQAGAQMSYFLPVAESVPDDSIPPGRVLALWQKAAEISASNQLGSKHDRETWVMRQKIIPSFNEPFTVFVDKQSHSLIDEHFYFLTQSGKVFVSRPAIKARKMEVIWDEPTKPIVGVITDMDRGKPYLFGRAQDKDPGKRHFIIELSINATDPRTAAKLHYYNPKELPEIVAPEPIRSMVEYGQALVAKHFIELPQKKKKK